MNISFSKVDPASMADLRILYALLSERKPWQSISHKKMPTFKEHREFVRSRPYQAWYIIFDGEDAVGCIYLTHNNEIGISIYDKFKGRGYGKAAVKLILDLYEGPFYANINPLNTDSREFFTRLGFGLVQVTYVHP